MFPTLFLLLCVTYFNFLTSKLCIYYSAYNSFHFLAVTIAMHHDLKNRPIIRYFSLSQYSDENMMDAYNLAVCFGPSVIDIPPRSDPVMCQANINSVIKVN